MRDTKDLDKRAHACGERSGPCCASRSALANHMLHPNDEQNSRDPPLSLRRPSSSSQVSLGGLNAVVSAAIIAIGLCFGSREGGEAEST